MEISSKKYCIANIFGYVCKAYERMVYSREE